MAEIIGKTKTDLELRKHLSNEDMKRIGNLIVKQIRTRTQGGVGVDPSGKEYNLGSRPYSSSYAKYKGVGKSDVDLTLTGDMLENMFVKSIDSSAIEISIKNRDYGKLRGAEEGVFQRQGKPNKNGKYKVTKVKRPFFRLSDNDVETIQDSKDYQRILDNATKKMISETLRKELERRK